MDINIGDTFKINHKKLKLRKPCKNPNKVFVVDSISKSGHSVSYIDRRTSIKCKCYHCDGGVSNVYRFTNPNSNSEIGNITRTISVDNIIIVERKRERERNLKLRIILNEFK